MHWSLTPTLPSGRVFVVLGLFVSAFPFVHDLCGIMQWEVRK